MRHSFRGKYFRFSFLNLNHAESFSRNTLQWRHNGCDGVSNHQPHDCLLNCLFRRRSKNTKAPCHWPLCGEFTGDRWIPCTMASNAENVSISWRHHDSKTFAFMSSLHIKVAHVIENDLVIFHTFSTLSSFAVPAMAITLFSYGPFC